MIGEYELQEIANNQDLQVVTVTDGMNGYPRNLHRALIGFESMRQADEIAKLVDGEVRSLRKRDGWQFYVDCGWISEPYDLLGMYVDDDSYSGVFTKDDESELRIALSDWGVRGAEARNAIQELRAMNPNYFLAVKVFHDRRLYTTLEPIRAMSMRDDVWKYDIAVVPNDY